MLDSCFVEILKNGQPSVAKYWMSGENWHWTEPACYNIKEPFNALLLILKVRHLVVNKV